MRIIRSCLIFYQLLRTCSASSQKPTETPVVLSGPQDVNSLYDFVIIGGGTSGLTIADRLTEDRKCQQSSDSMTFLPLTSTQILFWLLNTDLLVCDIEARGWNATDLPNLVYAQDILTVYGAIAPLANRSKYLYPINSVPQAGLNNASVPIWIGNLVGGSSAGKMLFITYFLFWHSMIEI